MTKDKTVTMSLELAEKALAEITSGAVSIGTGAALRAAIAAKSESYPCWSCKAPVTMANRADADGNCPHCEAELDLEDWPALTAPVVERQELAGWQRKSKHDDGRWFYLPDDDVEEAIRLGYDVRKVYTSPPAPVAVVLPEPRPYDSFYVHEAYYAKGWNACLDKVKELNQ